MTKILEECEFVGACVRAGVSLGLVHKRANGNEVIVSLNDRENAMRVKKEFKVEPIVQTTLLGGTSYEWAVKSSSNMKKKKAQKGKEMKDKDDRNKP